MNKFTFGCGGVLLVFVLIAVIFTIMAMGKYNTLVKLDQGVNQSWAQVQNVYQRRADLIPNLVNTVKGAADFEKTTLIAVTEARASVGQLKINQNQAPKTAEELERFQAAQGELGNALSRLLVVAEQYPQLKANENFRVLQTQLEGTENRIAVERRTFNQTVQDYNTVVKSFPTVLYAGMLGFQPRPYFRAQEGAEQVPTVNFDFSRSSPAPNATAAATP